jgi:hypothetical protein
MPLAFFALVILKTGSTFLPGQVWNANLSYDSHVTGMTGAHHPTDSVFNCTLTILVISQMFDFHIITTKGISVAGLLLRQKKKKGSIRLMCSCIWFKTSN